MMIIVVSDPNAKSIVSYLEMLSKARQLAAQSGSVVGAICFGMHDSFFYNELFKHGAHHVFCVQQDYRDGDYLAFSDGIRHVIQKNRAQLVMFPDTPLCKAAAATIATELGAGLTADCLDIDFFEEKFIFTRTALNSSVIAEIHCIHTPYQLCTVKKRVFHDCVSEITDAGGTLDFIDIPANKSIYSALKSLGYESYRKEEVDLENTKVIFAVGRGVKEQDFSSIQKLAKAVGAEIGGTRVLVENGLLPRSRQIGQSGIHVIPDLYIGFGISGASQHIVGMKSSKKIIAINNDKNAPIFRFADYAIIEDTRDVIADLLSAMEQKI
ncbi:electron transfer flavoprotein subunit alpha/FixB family protein [Paenibacillus sp. GCM10012306]|uniref:electron transfer flavoprotein subunit alpha/FixB family protein n=1 Tax=Paenibacillus sp. GCM10012306 TaxID=3317342 RepID=UPI00360DF977